MKTDDLLLAWLERERYRQASAGAGIALSDLAGLRRPASFDRPPQRRELVRPAAAKPRQVDLGVRIANRDGEGPLISRSTIALWLVKEGIQSMSLNPDSVIETWMFLAGEIA